MSKLPPKWAFEIYAKLWDKFKEKRFSNEEARKIEDSDKLNQAISRLKKEGLLKMLRDPKDSRKSQYELKHPHIAIDEIIENTIGK